jgi:branched-chain amino acid transport system substrate-binding protein
MDPKRSLQNKVVILVLALVLIVPILVACGKTKEQTPSSAPTSSATLSPTQISTTTSTPISTEPVKIGVIGPWSGPLAMAGNLTDQAISVVDKQVKDMGGVLGGREIKFVKGDDRGVVAESAAQAKKLILDDKVSILTVGSVSVAHMTAVAEVAEELKVPFVALGTIYGVESMKYSALLYDHEVLIARAPNFIADVVKPKTVALLGFDSEDTRGILNGVRGVEGCRERWKAEGLNINIVYEQYFPLDVTDFSPYLTKIKYENPDILIGCLNDMGQAITLQKQMLELGGWGNIKYFAASEAENTQKVIKMPSAIGIYLAVLWLPGSDEPGMKAFEDAFMQSTNRLPDPNMSFYYNCFWVAIKAIQLGGTDNPEKVAQALRSGNLEWDSAWGPMLIAQDGVGKISGMVAQVQEGGKLVKVWPQ